MKTGTRVASALKSLERLQKKAARLDFDYFHLDADAAMAYEILTTAVLNARARLEQYKSAQSATDRVRARMHP